MDPSPRPPLRENTFPSAEVDASRFLSLCLHQGAHGWCCAPDEPPLALKEAPLLPRAELEVHPHAVEHTEAAPARRQLLPLLVVAEGAGAARGGEVRVAFEAVLRHLSTARGVKRRRSQLEGTRTGAAPVHR